MKTKFIEKHFTQKLFKKKILWTKYCRVFCDGGEPIFKWYPVFVPHFYHKYWKMWGFKVYLFGREINFSFREDVMGLYKK